MSKTDPTDMFTSSIAGLDSILRESLRDRYSRVNFEKQFDISVNVDKLLADSSVTKAPSCSIPHYPT